MGDTVCKAMIAGATGAAVAYYQMGCTDRAFKAAIGVAAMVVGYLASAFVKADESPGGERA